MGCIQGDQYVGSTVQGSLEHHLEGINHKSAPQPTSSSPPTCVDQIAAEGAHAFAERLRLAIMDLEIPVAGEVVRVTASFGVSSIHMPHPSISAMISRADAALYRSKSGGA
jgi:GGDEF domain-containing protein